MAKKHADMEQGREWIRGESNFGRRRWTFRDCDGEYCFLQDSGEVGVPPRCRLGPNEVRHHHVTGDHLASIYLDQEQARTLGMALLHFAEKGYMPAKVRNPRGSR